MLGHHKPTEPAAVYLVPCQREYCSGDALIDGEGDVQGWLVPIFTKFSCSQEGKFHTWREETELKFCPICQLLSLPKFVKMPFILGSLFWVEEVGTDWMSQLNLAHCSSHRLNLVLIVFEAGWRNDKSVFKIQDLLIANIVDFAGRCVKVLRRKGAGSYYYSSNSESTE